MANVTTAKKETATMVAKNINLNKVYVTGRLLVDKMEHVQLENGKIINKGKIAVSRTYKGNEYTSFIDFELFSEYAIEMKKGTQVYIEGKVVSDEWQDENGNFHSKVKIIAFTIIPISISGNDINSVNISGRLVKDPVVVKVAEGRSAVKFRIAVNRNYQRDNQWHQITEYIDVVQFGSSEYIAKVAAKLGKGKFVYVNGMLYQERWKTESGDNRSKIVVIAEQINISKVEKRKNNENSSPKENNEKETTSRKKSKTSTTKFKSNKNKKTEEKTPDKKEDIENEIYDLDVDDIDTPF